MYENLKKELFILKNKLENNYLEFKNQYNLGNFEQNILLNSIRDVNKKINSVNLKIKPFFDFNKENTFNYNYKIINYKNILDNKSTTLLNSSVHSLFFNDFYIIIYPFGINGDSKYLDLGVIFSSKIKKNYDISLIFEIRNIDGSKKYSKMININSYNKIFNIINFYKTSKLIEENFLDNNGDFTIYYEIEFYPNNSFLYDIEDYYEEYINKISNFYKKYKEKNIADDFTGLGKKRKNNEDSEEENGDFW